MSSSASSMLRCMGSVLSGALSSGFTVRSVWSGGFSSGFTVRSSSPPSRFTVRGSSFPSGFTMRNSSPPSGFTVRSSGFPSGFTLRRSGLPSGFDPSCLPRTRLGDGTRGLRHISGLGRRFAWCKRRFGGWFYRGGGRLGCRYLGWFWGFTFRALINVERRGAGKHLTFALDLTEAVLQTVNVQSRTV